MKQAVTAEAILSAATNISPSAYLTACKRAVDTGDGQRVQSLIEQAESCLSEPLPALPAWPSYMPIRMAIETWPKI